MIDRTADGRTPAASYLLPLTVFVVLLCIRRSIPLNHDAAWFLIGAERIMAGGSYETDFFDMNMPLAILIYTPAALLHTVFGFSAMTAVTAWTAALVGQCLVLTAMIGRQCPDDAIRTLASPLGITWLAIGLVFMPGYDFAQREHLAAALFLPFMILLSIERIPSGKALRVYVSALAGIGFLIKPHYAALPALLMGIRARRLRSSEPFRGIEALSLLMVLLFDIVMVLLFFHGWLVCAQWAMDLYNGFHKPNLLAMVSTDRINILIPAVVLTLAVLSIDRGHTLALTMVLSTVLYSCLVFVVQMKGWRYQLLPALVAMFAAVPLAWGRFLGGVGARNRITWLSVLLGFMALADLVPGVIEHRTTARLWQIHRSSIAEALSPASRQDYVYCFSTIVEPIFPTVTLLDLKWASRFSPLWPLAGIGLAMRDNDPDTGRKMSRYGPPLIEAVRSDIERYQPTTVLIDHRPSQNGLPSGFDILGFFLNDAAFRQTWAQYEMIGQSSEYDIYVRRAP